MLVRMTNVGGPLDGTIEFEESSDFPKNADSVYALSRGVYELTKGVVGAGAQSASPLITNSIISGKGVEKDSRNPTIHKYFIVSNEVVDGVREVIAKHKPVNRNESIGPS